MSKLRSQLIRVAHAKPETRPVLLPLITKRAAEWSASDGKVTFKVGGFPFEGYVIEGLNTQEDLEADAQKVVFLVKAAGSHEHLKGLFGDSVYSLSYNGLEAATDSFVARPKNWKAFVEGLQKRGWTRNVGMRPTYRHPDSEFAVTMAENGHFIVYRA